MYYAEFETDKYIRETFFPDYNYRGTMVEVGAGHPTFISNSKHFKENGWRCICVEPNPDFVKLHKSVGNEIYEFACSNEEKDSNFEIVKNKKYHIDYPGITGSAIKVRQSFIDEDIEIIRVKVIKLNTLLEKLNVSNIDFVSIDVEGWEIEVMEGFDTNKYNPIVILLENVYHDESYVQYMSKIGYSLRNKIEYNYIFEKIKYNGQFSDDDIIQQYFGSGYVGGCVDVGSVDGIILSNTKYFEDKGWYSLCIEPNPNYFDELKNNRKNCLNYAVSNFNKDNVDFTIFSFDDRGFKNELSISSLYPDNRLIERFNGAGINPDHKNIKVSVRTLDFCLENYYKFDRIDFISIDTEGTELDVLKGFNIKKWQPKLIVVENNFEDTFVENYLKKQGYIKDKRIVVNDYYIRKKKNKFLIGPKLGDFLHSLYVVKFLTKDDKCDIYLTDKLTNYGTNLFVNSLEETYEDIYSIVMKHSFIDNFFIYKENEKIEDLIDLRDFYDYGDMYKTTWYEINRKLYNIDDDFPKNPWLTKTTNEECKLCKEKIFIYFSKHRYDYHFDVLLENILLKNKCTFITCKESEYEEFKYKDLVDLKLCRNFSEMYTSIEKCKFFIGNQSMPLAIAHGLFKPHLGFLNRLDNPHYKDTYNENYMWMDNRNRLSENFNKIKEFIEIDDLNINETPRLNIENLHFQVDYDVEKNRVYISSNSDITVNVYVYVFRGEIRKNWCMHIAEFINGNNYFFYSHSNNLEDMDYIKIEITEDDYLIQEEIIKIEKKKKFLLGPRLGDFLHSLYIVKCLSENKKCDVYITDVIDGVGDKFFSRGVEYTYNDIYDVVVKQPYINKFMIYDYNHPIENIIVLNDYLRKCENLYLMTWYDVFNKLYDVNKFKNEQWLYEINDQEYNIYKDTVIISFSHLRCDENFNFLLENIIRNNKCLFVACEDAGYDVFEFKNMVEFKFCDSFTEMYSIIEHCKFFVGNQTMPLAIAHGLFKPHLGFLHKADGIHYKDNFNDNYFWIDNKKRTSENFDRLYDHLILDKMNIVPIQRIYDNLNFDISYDVDQNKIFISCNQKIEVQVCIYDYELTTGNKKITNLCYSNFDNNTFYYIPSYNNKIQGTNYLKNIDYLKVEIKDDHEIIKEEVIKIIKKKKFLIGPRVGDFLHSLYAAKTLSDNQKCDIYITDTIENVGTGFFARGLENTYNDIYEVVMKQPYVDKFLIYDHDNPIEDIKDLRHFLSDYNTLYKMLWNDQFNHFYKIGYKYENEQWLYEINEEGYEYYSDKVIINFSAYRYDNNYDFLLENIIKNNDCLFLAGDEAGYNSFKFKHLLDLKICHSFTEMYSIIEHCKFFVGNQSMPLAIAHGLFRSHLGFLYKNDAIHYKDSFNKKYMWIDNKKRTSENFDILYDYIKLDRMDIHPVVNNLEDVKFDVRCDISEDKVYISSDSYIEVSIFIFEYELSGKQDIINCNYATFYKNTIWFSTLKSLKNIQYIRVEIKDDEIVLMNNIIKIN